MASRSLPRTPTAGVAARRPALGLADRRGLTAAGGALLAFAVGLGGALYDVVTGPGLGLVFGFAFVIGCALAVLAAHREDLLAMVFMPPLVYVVLALVGGALEGTGSGGSVLRRQALELLNAIILSAPVLLVATAVVLLLAMLRGLGQQR